MYAELLVSRQLSPFLQAFHGEHKANKRRNSFSIALLPIPGQRRAYGASDGDTVAAMQSTRRISFNDAKQVVIVRAQADATA
jgi:hypothetical protein